MAIDPARFAPASNASSGADGSGASSSDNAAAAGGAALPRVGKRGAPQAFARKLFEILTTESHLVIAWNADGTAFHVKDVESFSEETLTKYYRHSKFSSFQRQLNLYSFRKIVKGPDAGGYAHPMFRRDQPDDLYHVRRSISGSARYEPAAHVAASAAKTATSAARRGSGRAASKANSGAEWAPPPRAHKSSGAAAARRVGKLRRQAPTPSSRRRADHRRQKQSSSLKAGGIAAAAAAAAGPTDGAASSSSSGERSPWTSGESSDSDVSIKEASQEVAEQSSDDDSDSDLDAGEEGLESSNNSRREDVEKSRPADGAASDAGARRRQGGNAPCPGDAERQEQQQQQGRRFSCAEAAEKDAGERGTQVEESCDSAGSREAGGVMQEGRGESRGSSGGQGSSASSSSIRKSPFNFFKKTFSFMERSSSHNRGLSTSSVDMTTGEPAVPTSVASPPPVIIGGADGSPLMVDTSAAARAAAAGTGLGARPPPVTVTSGRGQAIVDPNTTAGNKVWTSYPLTPKSSTEAAAAAAAAAAATTASAAAVAAAAATAASAAMPPPPKREQREELGLVEQLTNMVEVFDICDLLRKVSTSNSSRLDKHGGIFKQTSPATQPHHLRNMSVDTDQGLPQSPDSRDGGQFGLGSLASMELVRDSSKDWDTLMAGSADVSDLGNTMVQSVAEFFSF